MNFNASRNVGQTGGIRKAKRVSDVAAVGAPTPPPPYTPGAVYNPGFTPNTVPLHEGIQLDGNHGLDPSTPGDNFSYMGSFSQSPMAPTMPNSPAQFGAVFQHPVVQDMTIQYGQQLASQGREIVNRELEKYVPVTKLRYYFAVDTRYVLKKLLLIFFPFTHKDWLVKYDQDTPVQPRYDINAPDLYIPSMAYITYVLLAGFMLGLQHRFSPEQLGIQSSSALAYIIFEIIVYLVTLYVTNTNTNLKTLDLLAFSGYKYTIMIASLLSSLILWKTAYYVTLAYSSFTLSYFLVKTLRVQVLAGSQVKEPPSYGYSQNPYMQGADLSSIGGTKRRVYFLLFVAITQPLLSWWLTHHLVPSKLVPDVAPSWQSPDVA